MLEFLAGVAVGVIPSTGVLVWLIWRERSAFISGRQHPKQTDERTGGRAATELQTKDDNDTRS
jgi:hypothetical protein